MSRIRTILVASGVTVALLAPVGIARASGPAAAPKAASPAIAWGSCTNPTLIAAKAQCGYLKVPLNYADPGGRQISLAVSRVRHTSSHYQGVGISNPGGPGASGLVLSILGRFVPNHVGDDYDWIGFDPRGVGSSKPALSCKPYYFAGPRPNYIPSTVALEQTWLARSKAYAQACEKDNAALLRNTTTIDSAKDLDSIRKALGVEKITYYGFSYGTYLGQVYSSLYPSRVRRMVLDSNVDPRAVWYQANLDQDIAFERNIKIWFAWLAKYDSVYHLGRTEGAVEGLYYAEYRRLEAHPAGGVVGPDEWNDVFLGAGYYQLTWLGLANIFTRWVNHGDAAPLVHAFRSTDGATDDNEYASYLDVQCSDTPWPQPWAKVRLDNWRTYGRAPFTTWGNAWFNGPCQYWPVPGGRLTPIDGRHVASVLLVDETLDAATPYEGSLQVRSLYPNARLLAVPGGTSHAVTLLGNACVDDTIARYLASGALPARKPGRTADATCAPLPQPVPTGAAATAAQPTLGDQLATRIPLSVRAATLH